MKWPFGKKQQAAESAVHSARREQNLKLLKSKGFLVAPHLPERGQEDAAALRPVEEIAGRLAALNALFAYAAAPESAIPTAALLDHVRAAKLRKHMTLKEAAILDLDRKGAGEQHGNAIGWRTENAVALAWVLGRQEPLAFDGTMLDGDQIRPLVMEWPPIDAAGFKAWASSLEPRPLNEVAMMEDLFFCAHNAARSAQVEMMEARGKPVRFKTVPPGFDAVANGGVIHERRHSLTWAVSPGVAWDETELST
jgi:hypothetical protein